MGKEGRESKLEFPRLELLKFILMLGRTDTSRKELEDGLELAKRGELVTGKKISGRMYIFLAFLSCYVVGADANLQPISWCYY